MTGVIYLAATPIGNVADASPRLIELLQTADLIAAEDSRRAVRLFRELGIVAPGRLISFYDAVEESKSQDLVAAAQAGQTVVVISDAGMPSVSDPGYRIVARALELDVPVRVVPGPSAVLAALAVSGLPVDRFCFEGFLPRQSGARRKALQNLVQEQRTMVFFEAPHRIHECLVDMCEVFGPERMGAVCRELTKTYEEVVREDLASLVTWATKDVRGEITVVIAGAVAQVHDDTDEWLAQVAQRVARGESSRDAITAVASELGVARREVYEMVMASRRIQS